jgi:tetratricopeptide (TPR) repeat protein
MAELRRRRWEWQEAEREYLRALELNPNLPQAYRGYSTYLDVMKRQDEAIAKAMRGRELDPLSMFITGSLAFRLYAARRYDEGIVVWRKMIELDPNLPIPYMALGDTYAAKGMYREAIAEYQEAIRVHGGTAPPIEAMIGVAYAKLGERGKAEEILQKVKAAKPDETPQNFGNIYERNLELLYDALGMRDEAFATLEKAYLKREPTLPLANTDPAFDNLRSDPRFADLMRRVGLPQ